MKFSELLGEPEPEPDAEHPEADAEPISVFAPVPLSPPPAQAPPEPAPAPAPGQAAPPAPTSGRSGLAELNVRQPIPEAPTEEASILDQLTGLHAIVDDLLPSAPRGRK